MNLRLALASLALAASCFAGAMTTYKMTFSKGAPPKKVTIPLEGFILIQLRPSPDGTVEKKPVTLEFKPTDVTAIFKVDGTMTKLVVTKTQAFSGRPTIVSHITFKNVRFLEVTSRESGPDHVEDVRFTYDTVNEVFDE
jgi:hypothetical protein